MGDQLFEALRKAYPQSWDDKIDTQEGALLEKPCGGFEEGMVKLWANPTEGRVQHLLTDMALYFSRFRPAGRTQYDELLQVLLASGQNQMVWATLNYECCLELVLQRAGHSIRSFGQIWGQSPTVMDVLKLHGSCNYVSPYTRTITNSNMQVGAYVYDEVTALHGPVASPELQILSLDELQRLYNEVGAFSIPPAISLYEPGKHSPTGASTIAWMRAQWAQLVGAVDLVISIGTRPVAHDIHIWGPVYAARCPVWFVGANDRDYKRLGAHVGSRLCPRSRFSPRI